MAGRRKERETRTDFRFFLDDLKVGSLEIKPLTNCITFASGVLELGLGNKKLRMREKPIVAAMVKVKVRINDYGNVVRFNAQGSERSLQVVSARCEDLFDIVVIITKTGINKHRTIRVLNEEPMDFVFAWKFWMAFRLGPGR